MPKFQRPRESDLPTSKCVERNSLDVYLDRAGRYPRLGADDERAALCRIEELRRTRWEALLAAPEVVRAIARWRDDEEPTVSLETDEQGLGDRLAVEVGRWIEGRPSALRRYLDAEAHDLDLEDYATILRQADNAYKHHRNRFLCANLRLVVKIAGRYANNRMSLADRVQEGNLGLLKAVERFDASRGTRFSTYAVWWIRHYVTRALVNRGRKIRIPAHLHRTFMKARAVEPALYAELGREPTVEELAEAIDVDPAKVIDARTAMQLRSIALDTPLRDDDGRSVADVLPATDEIDLDQKIDDGRNAARARAGLQSLDERAQFILRRRFGLDEEPAWTLRRIGARYDLSRERIRQLQNDALRSLRGVVEPEAAVMAA